MISQAPCSLLNLLYSPSSVLCSWATGAGPCPGRELCTAAELDAHFSLQDLDSTLLREDLFRAISQLTHDVIDLEIAGAASDLPVRGVRNGHIHEARSIPLQGTPLGGIT